VREYNEKTEQVGAMVQFKPEKVEKILEEKGHRYMWYQDTITLDEDLITGPFEWSKEPRYTIDKEHWEALPEENNQNQLPATKEILNQKTDTH
jgi:hypothetical protein